LFYCGFFILPEEEKLDIGKVYNPLILNCKMKRVIGSLLLVLVLSSFVFAGASSSAEVEFNIVDSSFVDSSFKDSRIERSLGSDWSISKVIGTLVLIVVIFVIFKRLFASPGKKKTSRKRRVVKKVGQKKK
jgi:hypothetical protein